jgi:hypothetical protein
MLELDRRQQEKTFISDGKPEFSVLNEYGKALFKQAKNLGKARKRGAVSDSYAAYQLALKASYYLYLSGNSGLAEEAATLAAANYGSVDRTASAREGFAKRAQTVKKNRAPIEKMISAIGAEVLTLKPSAFRKYLTNALRNEVLTLKEKEVLAGFFSHHSYEFKEALAAKQICIAFRDSLEAHGRKTAKAVGVKDAPIQASAKLTTNGFVGTLVITHGNPQLHDQIIERYRANPPNETRMQSGEYINKRGETRMEFLPAYPRRQKN